MSQRQAKRNRQLARRREDAIAGSQHGPAIVRQEEMFPSAIQISESSSFSGPLPPPDLLAEYEQVLPGLADRIVRMAEDEGAHRRFIQKGFLRLSWWGLASAFLLTMTGLIGGFFLIHEGKSPEGMTSIVGALATLLAVYLSRGKKKASAPGTRKP